MFTVSEKWKTTYPGAAVGILAIHNVANPERHAGLDTRKKELEKQLRAQFADYDRAALKALPIFQVYNTYYKQFKKSYHVQLQLESVVFKGKSIPNVAALVETMFMAELKNFLLTAVHDLEIVRPPIKIDVADGSERYIRINGQEQQLKAGDMLIADTEGILSSIIYGPDQRTRISSQTRQGLFTVYAPPGIEKQAVFQHLEDIRDYVLLITPEAEVKVLEVYGTDG